MRDADETEEKSAGLRVEKESPCVCSKRGGSLGRQAAVVIGRIAQRALDGANQDG
jgi:hypothetical protein